MAFINKDNIHRVHINEDYLLNKGYVFMPYITDFASLYPTTIGNFKASKYSKIKADVKFIKSFIIK